LDLSRWQEGAHQHMLNSPNFGRKNMCREKIGSKSKTRMGLFEFCSSVPKECPEALKHDVARAWQKVRKDKSKKQK